MQDFKTWLVEVVAGVRRYQQAEAPISDLGWHGWFHIYSVPSYQYNDEGEATYTPDEFAQRFDGQIPQEVTRRLQSFGFSKLPFTIVFQDYVLPQGTEATHERQLHMIRVTKNLAPDRILHVLAHEWAHAYWWSLPKEMKQSFTKYYILSFQQNTQLDTYALSGGAGEMFCEMIAEAITDPGKLSPQELKLVKLIASRAMPKFDLNQTLNGFQDPAGKPPATGSGARPL